MDSIHEVGRAALAELTETEFEPEPFLKRDWVIGWVGNIIMLATPAVGLVALVS